MRLIFESGTVSEDIYLGVQRAYTDDSGPKSANLLVDIRASTSIGGRTVEGVRAISQVILEHPARPAGRIAILLPPTEIERLTPVVEEFSAKTKQEIQIFEDDAAAKRWLAKKPKKAAAKA